MDKDPLRDIQYINARTEQIPSILSKNKDIYLQLDDFFWGSEYVFWSQLCTAPRPHELYFQVKSR